MADRKGRWTPALSSARLAAAAVVAYVVMAVPIAVAAGRHIPRATSTLRRSVVPLIATSASAPVAFDPRLIQTPGHALLSFELSSGVGATAFVLADPARVIVDLPEVNFQVDAAGPPHGAGSDLVSAYRVGMFAAGRSRIVIDLREPARIVKVETSPQKGGSARLIIELARSDTAAFRQAAALAASAEARRASARAATLAAAPRPDAATRTVIVLDPGHGGIDPGASGLEGAVEKDVVLAYARVLAARLEASGRYKVVMTRADDVFVSLSDRLKLARTAHAALMMSIHCDTIAASPEVGGTTVYTVSDRASDAGAARIAETENKADLAGGIDTKTEDASDVADILFEFTRRETRTYAHVFARTLVNYLKDSTRLNYNPQRAAGFWVLKAPDVPSVLIELGYLSSRDDVARLTSAAWREKNAAAMVAAVDDVFAAQPHMTDRTATVVPSPPVGEIAAGVLRGALGEGPGAPH